MQQRTVDNGVTEVPVRGPVPYVTHPGWADRFPWLCQGTTLRGTGEPFDLGRSGSAATDVRKRWGLLSRATGFETVVHARQVHGASVVIHGASGDGRITVGACDGHVTATPGVLLAVTAADCVPVAIVDVRQRAVALVHAGWRGTALGILAKGVEALRSAHASEPADLHVHMGPAICGACYEVGPEVHAALGEAVPTGPEPIDLRRILARQAERAGIAPHQITVSTHCSLCGDLDLFSHRAGDTGRHVGILGVRAIGS